MTNTLLQTEDALDQAVRWHDEARSLSEAGEFFAAGELLDRALARFEELSGPECPDVANLLNARGQVADKLGDAALARESFERAVRIMRRFLAAFGERGGVSPPVIAPPYGGNYAPPLAHSPLSPDSDVVRILVQSLNNLGLHERDSGKYDAAEPLYLEALQLAQRWLGETDLDTAMVLNSLGMWCKFTGRFERGRQVYQQALDILRHNLGADDSHSEIAALFHNLGGLEHTAGNFAAGEPFARKSVEIRRRAVGETHPDYAADVGGLAALVADQGRHDEAESLYREALVIFERVYGDDHYEIAVLLHNLAAVEVARERLDSAWDLYERAAEMKARWLGSDHPDLALTLHNLAILALDLDRPVAAATFCRRALTIFERNLVETHPTLLACRTCWQEIEAR